jgi:hypothetical protein
MKQATQTLQILSFGICCTHNTEAEPTHVYVAGRADHKKILSHTNRN